MVRKHVVDMLVRLARDFGEQVTLVVGQVSATYSGGILLLRLDYWHHLLDGGVR